MIEFILFLVLKTFENGLTPFDTLEQHNMLR